jgi:hypothetical protein
MKPIIKISLTALALLSQGSKAIKMKWVDIDPEVVEDEVTVDMGGNVHSLMQVKSSSDPIYPSVGVVPLKDNSPDSPEDALEKEMAAKKPRK